MGGGAGRERVEGWRVGACRGEGQSRGQRRETRGRPRRVRAQTRGEDVAAGLRVAVAAPRGRMAWGAW